MEYHPNGKKASVISNARKKSLFSFPISSPLPAKMRILNILCVFCTLFPIGFSTSLYHIRTRSQALPPFLTCLLLLEVHDALRSFRFSCSCRPCTPGPGRSGPRHTAILDTGAGTTHYCRYGQHEHSYFHSDQGESWSDPFPVLPGGEFRDKYGDGYHR